MSKDWTGDSTSVFKALGASNHTERERQKDDFYSTDPKALELFYPKFPIHHKVWECACGSGELSKWLESRGHGVLSSDLVDRGYGTYGIDFLKVEKDNEVLNKWAKGETFDILTILHTNMLPISYCTLSTLFLMTDVSSCS